MFAYAAYINRHKHQRQGVEQQQQPVVANGRMLREQSHKEQQTTCQALNGHKQHIKAPKGHFLAHLARHYDEGGKQQQQRHIERSRIATGSTMVLCTLTGNNIILDQRDTFAIGLYYIASHKVVHIIRRDKLQLAGGSRTVNVGTKHHIYSEGIPRMVRQHCIQRIAEGWILRRSIIYKSADNLLNLVT